MAAPTVAVVGMRALRRDINQMCTDQSGPLYAAIRAAGKDAVEPVASRVRASLPVDTGALVATVRTSGTRTGGNVRMGTAGVPYAGAVDFGGYPPGRQYMASGRYMFPAAQGLASVAADRYSTALEKILNSDLVWTNTGSDPGSVHD